MQTQALPTLGASRPLSTAQTKLIRRTVARNCTNDEFEEFMAVAAQCGLDPLRRQITPLIIDAADLERRRLICWTTIDGLRVIAARQGDYRPMETAPTLSTDDAAVCPELNPHGIIKAEVCAWKLRDGVWHPVAGEAWWDEYAPIFDASKAASNEDSEPARTLSPTWRRMGRVMIAKCAEAQALRRGWPNILAGLYGQEELHALHVAERKKREVQWQSRQSRQGKSDLRVLWFLFEPDGAFTPVRLSEAQELLCRRYERAGSSDDLEWFNGANRSSLQTLWEWAPNVAFEVKIAAERCAAVLGTPPTSPWPPQAVEPDEAQNRAQVRDGVAE
ncbi:MAG: phage recombination protein Bet [Hyphomonadaceae bacterium]|nr:phage recombination protein Bet [Hyphomonadaceae bacterium]